MGILDAARMYRLFHALQVTFCSPFDFFARTESHHLPYLQQHGSNFFSRFERSLFVELSAGASHGVGSALRLGDKSGHSDADFGCVQADRFVVGGAAKDPR